MVNIIIRPALVAGFIILEVKMSVPKIALSVSIKGQTVSVNRKYLEAIVSSGGMPSVLNPMPSNEYINLVTDYFDGFMFCGGGDIAPKYYGEEKVTATKNICSIRDEFEEMLFRAVYSMKKPILGICRGMQVINVFMGGSLYQDIPGHMQTEARHICTHEIDIVKDSMLEGMLGEEKIRVNSFHHQATKRLASDLKADAVSRDGYVEAYHREGYKFLFCAQWHPEAYYDRTSCSKRIFDAFISACE